MIGRRLGILLGVMVIGAAALVACGGDDGGGGSGTPELTAQQAENPMLVQGREVYVANCVQCHGAAGGGGSGPQLSDGAVAENLTFEEQVDVITNGRGAMPSWEGDLDRREIESVARFEREVL